MNSQIELYPHNQIAYDKLCGVLSHSDRACVIQPTGTGKFVIIAKLVQDNPDKRFLLLGTNDYMFIDQMDNLERIAPGFHPENLQFKTYAAAMKNARDEQIVLNYDFIIADEFHHCGAPEWSKGVQWFIDGSPDAKLVGFSATPIRFSDNGRDMADELFDGNVASSMELEEAWLRGILPIPKYVIALYNAPSELGELKVSIEKVRDEKRRSKLAKKYEELRRSLENAVGVDVAIAKHLKKSDAKVIVFCPSNEKLQEFMALSHAWFHGVNGDIHVYKTTSADPTAGTEDFQMFKNDDSGALKVLYCINQLNEAVHISGIDAIVMVRPTKSPTIFHQQLGRALSSGNNGTPLVFDLCNNFGSLGGITVMTERLEQVYGEMVERGEKATYVPKDFEVIDAIKGPRELVLELHKGIAEAISIDDSISFLESLVSEFGVKLNGEPYES